MILKLQISSINNQSSIKIFEFGWCRPLSAQNVFSKLLELVDMDTGRVRYNESQYLKERYNYYGLKETNIYYIGKDYIKWTDNDDFSRRINKWITK